MTFVGIIWHDRPHLAVEYRDELRRKAAEKGERAYFTILDSAMFAPGDLGAANAAYLFPCARKDEIIAGYRSDAFRARFGEVTLIDVETGLFDEPVSVPDIPNQPAEADPNAEPDLHDQTLDLMSDDDLRAYVYSLTGKRPHANMSRDKLLAQARAG